MIAGTEKEIQTLMSGVRYCMMFIERDIWLSSNCTPSPYFWRINVAAKEASKVNKGTIKIHENDDKDGVCDRSIAPRNKVNSGNTTPLSKSENCGRLSLMRVIIWICVVPGKESLDSIAAIVSVLSPQRCVNGFVMIEYRENNTGI